jgi:hypothetical protein
MGVNEPAEDTLAVPVLPDALAAGLVAAEPAAAEPAGDAELPQPARMPARTVSSTVRPSLVPLMLPGTRVRLDRDDLHSRLI